MFTSFIACCRDAQFQCTAKWSINDKNLADGEVSPNALVNLLNDRASNANSVVIAMQRSQMATKITSTLKERAWPKPAVLLLRIAGAASTNVYTTILKTTVVWRIASTAVSCGCKHLRTQCGGSKSTVTLSFSSGNSVVATEYLFANGDHTPTN